MKVAVTGASGFLGRQIVAELSARGIAVIAVARRAASAPAGVETRTVSDYAETPAADVLVHLAEESRLAVAEQEGEALIAGNVARLERLLAARRFARVLYGSSAAVYGDASPRPHCADEALAGTSIYARAKQACERVVLAAGGVALRFANIIGPGMSESAVLSRVLAQIPGAGDLSVHDDSAVRDFLWGADMAACVAALVTGRAAGAFNVGSGEGTSVRRLAELALEVAGESHRKVVSGPRAAHASQLVLDIDATRAATAWQPRVRLDAAIHQLLQFRHV